MGDVVRVDELLLLATPLKVERLGGRVRVAAVNAPGSPRNFPASSALPWYAYGLMPRAIVPSTG